MAEIDVGIPGLVGVEKIGSGRSTTVYSATDVDGGRRVVVTVLAAVDAEDRRRFDQESRALARATGHENIVAVLASGYTDPGGRPYLVMEYLPGGSLQDRLDERGPLGIPEAVGTITAVVEGLTFAHSGGIMHTDIRPANIVIGPTGAKLGGFGTASVRSASATGEVTDALAYTAPEIAGVTRGSDAGVGDLRNEQSDLYSLAATFYALVSGTPPFSGGIRAEVIHQILTEAPPPTGYADLDEFFARALAKDPADRYPTVARFTEALRSLDTTPADAATRGALASVPREPIGGRLTISAAPDAGEAPPEVIRDSPPDGPSPGFRLPGRRWWIAVATVAAVVAAGLVVIIFRATGGRDAPDSITTATDPDETRTSLTAPPEPVLITYTGHAYVVYAMVELSDGRIASAGGDGTVQIWDPDSSGTAEVTYTGHTGAHDAESVVAVAELSDGRIASAGYDGTVHIWDPDSPETAEATYTGHTGAHDVESVVAVVELSDGRIASVGGTVQIWDPDNPEAAEVTYTGHTESVTAVTQLSDGRIASADYDGTVQIWDPDNPGTVEVTYTGHTAADYSVRVTAVVELSDGRIASAGYDGTVQIWDPDSPGTAEVTYTGHAAIVVAVVELSDGRIASVNELAPASGGGNGVVQIWDPDNPDVDEVTYDAHAGGVFAVVELSDGRIASTNVGGSVHIWDPDNHP